MPAAAQMACIAVRMGMLFVLPEGISTTWYWVVFQRLLATSGGATRSTTVSDPTGTGTLGMVGFMDTMATQDVDLATALATQTNVANNGAVQSFGTIANRASCPTP
jgi:hypothetical protein